MNRLAYVLGLIGRSWCKGSCNYSLELAHVQDVTNSYGAARDQIAVVLPDFFDSVVQDYPLSEFAYLSFGDKPVNYLGWGSWAPYDYCFQADLPMTRSVEDAKTAVSDIQIISGMDYPEGQLEAMQHAALNASVVGWSDRTHTLAGDPIVRVMVFATDALYHIAGDAKKNTALMQDGRVWETNNGDGYLDCTGEDYPTIEQVRTAMQSRIDYVIFLVTPNPSIVHVYEELLAMLDVPGTVLTLEITGEAMMEALNEGLDALDGFYCDTPLPPSCKMDLEYFWLQDVTTANALLIQNVAPLVTDIYGELDAVYNSVQIGLASFSDKPVDPLGWSEWEPVDYCYRHEVALSYSPGDIGTSLADLNITSGRDLPHSQLDALLHAALSGVFSDVSHGPSGAPLLRVAGLVTTSASHQAGDAALKAPGKEWRENDGDSSLDCEVEDYASIFQVAAGLKKAGVMPVAFVPHEVYDYYISAFEEMNIDALVVRMEIDGTGLADNIVDAVAAAARVLSGSICNSGATSPPPILGSTGAYSDDVAIPPVVTGDDFSSDISATSDISVGQTTSGQTDGVGTTSGQTDGVGTTSGQTDGVGTTSGQTDGVGTTSGQTDGVGTTSGQTDGVGTTSGQTDGVDSTAYSAEEESSVTSIQGSDLVSNDFTATKVPTTSATSTTTTDVHGGSTIAVVIGAAGGAIVASSVAAGAAVYGKVASVADNPTVHDMEVGAEFEGHSGRHAHDTFQDVEVGDFI